MAVTGATTRYTGLASGLDTDDIIKKLMTANRAPLTKLKQQKQMLEWRRDEFRSFNMKFFDFKSAANDMKRQSTFLAKTVSSSNDKLVTGTGTADAVVGQHKIKIDRLAESASIRTGELDAIQGRRTTLESLGIEPANAGEKIKISIGGEKGSAEIELDATATIGELVAAISNQSPATGVKATYDESLNRLFLSSSGSGNQSAITLSDNLKSLFTETTFQTFEAGSKTLKDTDKLEVNGEFNLKVDGKELKFNVTTETTVAQLVKRINENTEGGVGTGVSAILDSAGKLSLVRDNGDTLDLSGTDSTLLTNLGLNTRTSVSGVTGTDAKVQYNGITQYYNSNNFQIAGINFVAKQQSTEEVTIGVAKDVDTVFEKIKGFVDKYNELIATVNSKLDEKRYRDYAPLTDEQREEMKEEEIKKWEEKAKSGMLRSDPLLNGALVSMRNGLSNAVTGLGEGALKALGELGISSTLVQGTTISGTYQDKGKLFIDEDKLKQAISDNPDQIYALFTRDDGDKKTTEGDGILTRITETIDGVYAKIRDKAGLANMNEDDYAMGKELKTMNKRLTALQTRMKDLETRYYKQFTTLETYLNKMNSQSAWLTQQFSS